MSKWRAGNQPDSEASRYPYHVEKIWGRHQKSVGRLYHSQSHLLYFILLPFETRIEIVLFRKRTHCLRIDLTLGIDMTMNRYDSVWSSIGFQIDLPYDQDVLGYAKYIEVIYELFFLCIFRLSKVPLKVHLPTLQGRWLFKKHSSKANHQLSNLVFG